MLPNVIHSVLQTCHIIQSDKVKKKIEEFFFHKSALFLRPKMERKQITHTDASTNLSATKQASSDT